jgi:hypothetical protein
VSDQTHMRINGNDVRIYTYSEVLTWLTSRPAVRFARIDWAVNDKGEITDNEFIYLVPGSTFAVSRAPLNVIYPEGHLITYQPHIDKRFSNGTVGVWTPSNEDQLTAAWIRLAPAVQET